MPTFDEEQLNSMRRMISQAVENEFSNQSASAKNKYQIDQLNLDMLKRDFASMKETVNDLKEVVLGNEALGIRGLLKQVHDLDSSLITLNEKINKWTHEVEGFRKALWVFSALLGVSGLAGIQSILKGFGIIP
jgi:phosphoglycerate-specific signal transduction histidine kinase